MQFATFHDLEDQSIFITGGGSGIGADLTKGFLSQGAQVTFIQRSNPEKFLIDCKGKYKHEPRISLGWIFVSQFWQQR